ncbi:MAG: family 10 glycosylhydrolase [bacterium]|nr:family 10 glycosylhydrolase [Candidatus Sumerlaeota bacterium]
MSKHLLLAVLLIAWPMCDSAQGRAEYRMLWVDVFHPGLRSPAEIDTMLAAARTGNYNAIIVQMRKACDAFYNSGVEPKNASLDPSFDPLDYLLRRAHGASAGQQPLEVHAWLVAYRCRMPNDDTWRNPRHVSQRHPEWLSQKFDGSKEDRGESAGRFYLDPGVPAVIDYTVDVVRDMLSHYDLDGIVFDYFRYPESKGPGNQWGYNPAAVARFNALYGRAGKPDPGDPQWCDFRRRQVANLMRKVCAHARLWRPQIKVSAALITWGEISKGFERSDAYASVMQDWPAIAQAGFMDIMLPMNYKREHVAGESRAHREWARFLAATAIESGRFGVNVIDGEGLNSLDGILAQAKATSGMRGLAGLSTYCYAETRRGAPQAPDMQFFQAIRSSLFSGAAKPPDAPWLTRPSEGIIKGIVTRRGKRVDGARVELEGQSTLTDGTGFYAFARMKPGERTLRASDSSGATAAAVTVTAGGVTEAPLTLQNGR